MSKMKDVAIDQANAEREPIGTEKAWMENEAAITDPLYSAKLCFFSGYIAGKADALKFLSTETKDTQ